MARVPEVACETIFLARSIHCCTNYFPDQPCYIMKYHLFTGAYSPGWTSGPLFGVPWSHTYKDTRYDSSGRVISPPQRPLPAQDNTTYKHSRQTSMPRKGFEPATPATKRPQTYALHCAATGIGILWNIYEGVETVRDYHYYQKMMRVTNFLYKPEAVGSYWLPKLLPKNAFSCFVLSLPVLTIIKL
jgi:hypothetical protein